MCPLRCPHCMHIRSINHNTYECCTCMKYFDLKMMHLGQNMEATNPLSNVLAVS